jgi:hypothetical protein
MAMSCISASTFDSSVIPAKAGIRLSASGKAGKDSEMSDTVSIELNDAVRELLEAEARSRNITLSSLLSEIFNGAARQIRRKRIREQSEAVGRYVASHPEAREFYEFWGRPDWEFLGEPPDVAFAV